MNQNNQYKGKYIFILVSSLIVLTNQLFLYYNCKSYDYSNLIIDAAFNCLVIILSTQIYNILSKDTFYRQYLIISKSFLIYLLFSYLKYILNYTSIINFMHWLFILSSLNLYIVEILYYDFKKANLIFLITYTLNIGFLFHKKLKDYDNDTINGEFIPEFIYLFSSILLFTCNSIIEYSLEDELIDVGKKTSIKNKDRVDCKLNSNKSNKSYKENKSSLENRLYIENIEDIGNNGNPRDIAKLDIENKENIENLIKKESLENLKNIESLDNLENIISTENLESIKNNNIFYDNLRSIFNSIKPLVIIIDNTNFHIQTNKAFRNFIIQTEIYINGSHDEKNNLFFSDSSDFLKFLEIKENFFNLGSFF